MLTTCGREKMLYSSAVVAILVYHFEEFYNVFISWSKVKVGVLRPVQQPGSYWDRSSALPLVGLEPTEVTAYD